MASPLLSQKRMHPMLLASVCGCALLSGAPSHAFAPLPNSAGARPTRSFAGVAAVRPSSSHFPLRMAGEETETKSQDGARVEVFGRKEIGYDEKSGRFYESGEDIECQPDEGEYCAVDKETGELVRLTLEEKERIFLDALQSYYASGRQLLSDSEFDLLKEDLQWNGSDMVVMNRKEAKYLGAMQAYLKGTPIMSDEEYNTLKADLREEGSKFAVSTEPKCYIDTGICTVTLQEDKFRSNLLYLPVGAILSLVWLGLGYEIIEPVIPLNPLILILLGAYPVFKLTTAITEAFVFQDFKIAYGPCPVCEARNRIYFGDILFVEGFKDVADVKCTNCKSQFQVQRNSLRASTLPK